MSNGTIGIAECPTPDRLVDNEVLTVGATEVYRQRVISPTEDALRYDLLSYAEELIASDSIVPSSGMRIEVVWVQVIAAPDNTTDNLVTIGFDSGTILYKVYTLGRSAVFVGDTDQPLDITLENSEKVTVNIHYREVT